MNICYLILAHNNPKHLERLLGAIRAPGTMAFVHIDQKASMDSFHHLMGREDVVFIDQRIPVSWGGFSDVQATLYLIDAARSCEQQFDYFCLLSGTHYPVQPPEKLREYLSIHQGRQFISLTAAPNEAVDRGYDRFTLVYIDRVYHRRFGLPQKLTTFIARAINKCQFHREFEPVFGDQKPYGGCQWWVLSDAAIAFVQNWVRQHPDIVRYFGKTLLADESFFQTIIGNSPFLEQTQRDLTLTSWSKSGGAHPEWLTEAHIKKLSDDEMVYTDDFGTADIFFARKFSDESSDLVDQIDQTLLRVE